MHETNKENEYIKFLASDFCHGTYDYKVKDKYWSDVFKYIITNQNILSFDKNDIHTLWTVNGGHLRRKISDDDLVLEVLKICLPKYHGSGLKLFRGECNFLFVVNKIGFCWTPKIEVARIFASGLNAIESGGVLLEAFAPASAILAPPNRHSTLQMQEYEYTCNPKALESITIIERYDRG